MSVSLTRQKSNNSLRSTTRLNVCTTISMQRKETLTLSGASIHARRCYKKKFGNLSKQLPTINILITTPFHPANMTKDRIQKAKNLELIVTAGVGSDRIDLHAAAEAGLTVAEITGGCVCCEALKACITESSPNWSCRDFAQIFPKLHDMFRY
jgi:hypothetical protein